MTDCGNPNCWCCHPENRGGPVPLAGVGSGAGAVVERGVVTEPAAYRSMA